MSAGKLRVRPSDLGTKTVRARDGKAIKMKVVCADSDTLALDFLAAFQSNVTRVRSERRKAKNGSHAAKA
jgi:hypothetical protein